MAYIPSSGSVVAFQSNSSVFQGTVGLMSTNASVITVGTAAANQSVSGTVQTDVRGSVATVIIGGSIAASFTPPANQSVSGTVHVDNFSSVIAYQLAGSVLATSATVNPAANQSVSGTVHIDNFSSVVSYQLAGSVLATNVSGSVVAFQAGTQITSLVSTVPSSVIVGASIFGTAPVTQAGTWIASVFGNVSVIGTVPVTQSGAWTTSVVGFPTNQNVSGSVIAFMAGTQSSSMYGMRNDAVASFLGADLTVRPLAVDSAGRTIVKPFAAQESTIEGYVSLTSTSVTTLVAAAGAGLRNYITDIIIANTGAATTLVTFSSGGGASILGYTIAPTGGGSNIIGMQVPIRTNANETFGIQAGTATSTLYATVKGYKAP